MVLNNLLFESASASLGVCDALLATRDGHSAVRQWLSGLVSEAATASYGGLASDFSTLFAFLLALLLQSDTARYSCKCVRSICEFFYSVTSIHKYFAFITLHKYGI